MKQAGLRHTCDYLLGCDVDNHQILSQDEESIGPFTKEGKEGIYRIVVQEIMLTYAQVCLRNLH